LQKIDAAVVDIVTPAIVLSRHAVMEVNLPKPKFQFNSPEKTEIANVLGHRLIGIGGVAVSAPACRSRRSLREPRRGCEEIDQR